MSIRGPLSHIDLSVADPNRSVPFYAAFFAALGYRRFRSNHPDFTGERPRRAAWFIRYAGGGIFGVEVRPATPGSRGKVHDRYAPGLHHLAFHVESRAAVDDVYAQIQQVGGTMLDPPADYSGQEGYTDGYYAAFFADPDGVKLEVVYEPLTNP
jgi:catechol 2,3-dioxygenase-like lactoylglutathione lyase family enzyme